MSMEEINKAKRFKLGTIILAIPIIVGLSFGIYWKLQPEESVGWDESGFEQTQANDSDLVKTSIPGTTKSSEQIADEAAKLVEQMKQSQQQQATMVNGKQVELINEPAPEPVVEPTPRYESKEEAAKNPPPKPTETAKQQPTQNNNTGGSNSGGSNLVPPEQNPFLNPANASNAQATPSNSKYVSGTGDKF
ncbi:hypothetical protein [Desulfosporosinus lacus]|uniref:Uncharacterized protein n=1 Tax=Desulfosporosinus lacus DSM 15449 TaxID=1121420 RepID=A0A1M5Q862_9FIRM|nr:hypothetical protein [Desulfosporosinus lacus]SHH10178.1 hypothetical protein SAMN02746098_00170 [Desulfosporosinus lacus DSM 15449]